VYFRERENVAIEMTLNQGRLVQGYCKNDRWKTGKGIWAGIASLVI
jgi:hypothetical protein